MKKGNNCPFCNKDYSQQNEKILAKIERNKYQHTVKTCDCKNKIWFARNVKGGVDCFEFKTNKPGDKINITIPVEKVVWKELFKLAKKQNMSLAGFIRDILGWQSDEVFPELFTGVNDKELIKGLGIMELPLKSMLDHLENAKKFTKNKNKLYTLNWLHRKLNFTYENAKIATSIFMDEIEKQDLEEMHIIYTSFFNFINNVKKDKSTMKKLVELCKTKYMLEN